MAPPQSLSVTLPSGTHVQLQLTGEGAPTRVWLHGLGSIGAFWQRNVPHLNLPGRDVVVDLPGFGASDPLFDEAELAPATRLLTMTDALMEVLAHLQISDATWIGHSMGGQLALLAAIRYPYRVNRLVLTAPAGIEPYTAQQVHALDELAQQGNQSLLPLRALRLLTLHLRAGRHTPPMDPRPAAGEFGKRLLWAMQGMVHQPLLAHLRFVRQPTLLLMGLQDGLIPNRWFHPHLTPAQVAQDAVQRFSQGHLDLLLGGHFLPWEQAEAWNSRVRDWLS